MRTSAERWSCSWVTRNGAGGAMFASLRLAVHLLGIVEPEVFLERMILVQLDEVELVLVIRQEAERRAQHFLNGRTVPEIWIAYGDHKVQIASPAVAEGVNIICAAPDNLVGAVDVGGDLQQIVEQRGHRLEHFSVNILDAQGDVAFAFLARQAQPQIAFRIFADALGGGIATQDVSFILHRCVPPPSVRPSSWSVHSSQSHPTISWRCRRLPQSGALKTTRWKTAQRSPTPPGYGFPAPR